MEPLVVAFTLLTSIGLAVVAAYAALSIPLSVMQRAVMPTVRRVVERSGVRHVHASVGPTEAHRLSASAG